MSHPLFKREKEKDCRGRDTKCCACVVLIRWPAAGLVDDGDKLATVGAITIRAFLALTCSSAAGLPRTTGPRSTRCVQPRARDPRGPPAGRTTSVSTRRLGPLMLGGRIWLVVGVSAAASQRCSALWAIAATSAASSTRHDAHRRCAVVHAVTVRADLRLAPGHAQPAVADRFDLLRRVVGSVPTCTRRGARA